MALRVRTTQTSVRARSSDFAGVGRLRVRQTSVPLRARSSDFASCMTCSGAGQRGFGSISRVSVSGGGPGKSVSGLGEPIMLLEGLGRLGIIQQTSISPTLFDTGVLRTPDSGIVFGPGPVAIQTDIAPTAPIQEAESDLFVDPNADLPPDTGGSDPIPQVEADPTQCRFGVFDPLRGVCVPEGQSSGGGCPPGLIFDPRTGQCTVAFDDGSGETTIECPEGFEPAADAGHCIRVGSSQTQGCPDGFFFDGVQCVPEASPDPQGCPDGFVFDGVQCVPGVPTPDTGGSGSCPPGFLPGSNGECVVACPPGTIPGVDPGFPCIPIPGSQIVDDPFIDVPTGGGGNAPPPPAVSPPTPRQNLTVPIVIGGGLLAAALLLRGGA